MSIVWKSAISACGRLKMRLSHLTIGTSTYIIALLNIMFSYVEAAAIYEGSFVGLPYILI